MIQTTTSESFVLPIDKPAGPTSHDIVARARRALKTRRIGHTGTLDPFASGLLLLCVNNATRLAEYMTRLPKKYEAELLFGSATDTDDCTGTAISTSDAWRTVSGERAAAAFEKWRGTHAQLPSQYSAKKIDGERAYEAARRGESIVTERNEITIHDIEILEMDMPRVRFRVSCSSGTYIRALARDIGQDLGTFAHLTALRRTHIGPHDVSGAVPAEAMDDATLVERAALSSLEAVAHMPRIDLDDAQLREIGFGRGFAAPVSAAAPAGGASGASASASASASATASAPADEIALAHDGELVAIAFREGDVIRPRKVFPRG